MTGVERVGPETTITSLLEELSREQLLLRSDLAIPPVGLLPCLLSAQGRGDVRPSPLIRAVKDSEFQIAQRPMRPYRGVLTLCLLDPLHGEPTTMATSIQIRDNERSMSFRLGDVIAVRCKKGLYIHYGIYLGEGRVIHFDAQPSSQSAGVIQIVTLGDFLGDLPSTCLYPVDNNSPYSAEEIVERAVSRLGERNYCAFTNNCEHFVNWCLYGSPISSQVARVARMALKQGARLSAKVASQAAVKAGSKLAFSTVARTALNPWLVAADLASLATEHGLDLAGCSPQSSRMGAAAAGSTTAVALGALLGGPIGAALGLGTFVVGEMIVAATVKA